MSLNKFTRIDLLNAIYDSKENFPTPEDIRTLTKDELIRIIKLRPLRIKNKIERKLINV